MNKLVVGVYLEDYMVPDAGGGFAYMDAMVSKIDNYEFDNRLEIRFLHKGHPHTHTFKKKVEFLKYQEIHNKQNSLIVKLKRKFLETFYLPGDGPLEKYEERFQKKIKKKIEQQLVKKKIDLIYYLTPGNYIYNYPFIATHWDMGHKSMYAFPEVSMNGSFESREFYHRTQLLKAFAIFAESNLSKEELVNFEGINKERIFIVPLFPGRIVEKEVSAQNQIEILQKWGLTSKQFLFYPAQFWSHKNHYGLLMAFQIVFSKYPNYKLVLTGSDKGNKAYIEQLCRDAGLEKHVIFTGFVPEDDLYTFFKNATGMVFPSYLGPTNMPLPEAAQLGCPILCSDLEGHRQQMGGSACYFKPQDHIDLANKILSLIEQKLVFEPFHAKAMDTGEILNQHFLQILPIRKTFGLNFDQF